MAPKGIPEFNSLANKYVPESVPEFVPSAHEDSSEFNYAAPKGLPESTPVAQEGPPKPTFFSARGHSNVCS